MLIKFALVIFCYHLSLCLAANFNKEFDVSWGDGRARVLNDGKLINMSLDITSGSGVQSKNEYLFGKIDMQLKLVPNNSAGTVTAYFLSSEGETHDEIDFEFLGNVSGEPYTLHTNIFTQGRGGREQQFYLWFDPTANFHTYSILWNPQSIIFYVDGIPIRVFNNLESRGVPYPSKQPMRVYSSLWNADSWATRDGLDKIDWAQAPFRASLRNFKAQACVWKSKKSSCNLQSRRSRNKNPWLFRQLDSQSEAALELVRQNYMIYDYCSDTKRFVYGLPLECTVGKIHEREAAS